MYRVYLRFYEELNDFLPRAMRKRDIESAYKGRRSVKDLIESFGVPHVEVDLVLVNGQSVGFSRLLSDGDRVSVYPVFETFDIGDVIRLRPVPLREPAFVLDVHLGRLARLLRLLGFDADYDRDRDDAALAMISSREKRTLLTRDRGLLMRRVVDRGLYVRNTDPGRQIVEVIDRLDLWSRCAPFTRCMECNCLLAALDPGRADHAAFMAGVPSGVLARCREYRYCSGCRRIYWKGSHYDRLAAMADDIMKRRDARDER